MIRGTTRWALRGVFLLALVAGVAIVLAPPLAPPATWSAPARADVMQDAANEVAQALFTQLPAEVTAVAILPFVTEPDDSDSGRRFWSDDRIADQAWHDVNASFVELVGEQVHVVTRLEEEWALLDGEELFTERNADQMTELPGFDEKYPATAIVWGRVREMAFDADRGEAYARIELRAGMPGTWRVLSVTGVARARVEPPTMMSGVVLPLVRDPSWWMAAAGAIVVGVAILMLGAPIRRRVEFATSPRRLVR